MRIALDYISAHLPLRNCCLSLSTCFTLVELLTPPLAILFLVFPGCLISFFTFPRLQLDYRYRAHPQHTPLNTGKGTATYIIVQSLGDGAADFFPCIREDFDSTTYIGVPNNGDIHLLQEHWEIILKSGEELMWWCRLA